MKVKTNLRPEEMEVVGEGLRQLAKGQRKEKGLSPENAAETALLEEVDSVFTEMVESLEEDVSSILME